MRNKLVITAVFLILSSTLLSLFSCGTAAETQTTNEVRTETEKAEDMTVEKETEAVTEPASGNVLPEEGSVVSLLSAEMTAWLENYKKGKLDKICDYTEKCEPSPVRFSWEKGADYTHLIISEAPDMSDPVIYLCTGDSLEVEDLLPGTEYFWQTVRTAGDETKTSEIHSFRTLQTPRTVYIPGVSNVRDLGGKITSDGKRIKYGMVFRGADFAHITDEGVKKAVDVLGIKTELDLRSRASGRSSLGDGVKYISVTAPYYGGVAQAGYKNDLLDELRAFTDPDNYPIYFHCSLGRDRTGTLAFILLTLLGANETDIYIDYEISFFSDMGGYVDTTAPSYMVQQLDALKGIVAPGKKAYANLRKYLIGLGMTDEELDAIRANLLEDVK